MRLPICYPPMLCVSTAFAIERCPSVRLSVCPSVTIQYRVKTAQPIVEILSSPDGADILLFLI